MEFRSEALPVRFLARYLLAALRLDKASISGAHASQYNRGRPRRGGSVNVAWHRRQIPFMSSVRMLLVGGSCQSRNDACSPQKVEKTLVSCS